MDILHDFVLRGVLGMAGGEPEYKVIQYAAGWLDKGVLTVQDIEQINAALAAIVPPDTAEEPIATPDTEDTDITDIMTEGA